MATTRIGGVAAQRDGVTSACAGGLAGILSAAAAAAATRRVWLVT